MGTMRREPGNVMKAGIDGGKRVEAGNRGRAFVAALLLTVVAVLALAATASAHLVYPYEFKKSFTGSTSTGGPISSLVQRVALNQANGNVYVLDQHSGHADISQFNSNGEPQSWTGLGATNTIELAGPISGNLIYENDLLFDNTGHDFGLFILGPQAAGNSRVASYNADGTVRLPGFTSLGGNPCGLGLSAEGVLYVGGQFPTMWSGETGELVHPPTFEGPLSEQQACHITFDNEN